MQDEPDVLDIIIPNYFDDVYEYDIERPHTLRQALDNFEKNVEAIRTVTESLRADKFSSETNGTYLDWYYFDWNDEVTPSYHDNYYYTLTMPTLLDVEYALEHLEGKDTKAISQKVEQLKAELWQMLPDFYKGHTNPPLQPLSYDPTKPYPYKCVSGSLKESRDWKVRTWQYALRDLGNLDEKDNLKQFMPKDDATLSTVDFIDGDVTIDGQSAPSDIFWTEMRPFEDMLLFAEDVASMRSPAYLGIDTEGPMVLLFAENSLLAERVKLLVHWDSGSLNMPSTILNVSGLLDRRQLINCLIKQCDVVNHYFKDPSHPDEYFDTVEQMTKRLKAII